MKMFSFSASCRVLRHLSTTAAVTRSPTLSIGKAKWMLYGEQDPEKMVQIYYSVSNPLSTEYTREIIAHRFAKAKRFDDVEKFIDAHKKDPSITNERFFCSLIRCYRKAGMFDNALKLYGEMEELGTTRTCLSFNSLLAAANDVGLFDRVPQLFVEMPERYGFKPNESSYGVLIKSYIENGDAEMGLKVLGEMEEKGVKLTAVSLTMVYDALCKSGKKDEAERVWGEAVNKGCVVDVAGWNARIAHALDGLPETINGYIDEMRAAGLKPDSTTYNYLLTCYCENDRFDEAIKVFDDLVTKRFKPKTTTFKTMIHYLCRKEDYARGYDMFRKSVEYRNIPSFDTLKELLEGMVKNNMRDDAKSVISIVKRRFPSTYLDAWKNVEAELGLLND